MNYEECLGVSNLCSVILSWTGVPLVKIQGERAPYACRKVCISKAVFFICTSLAFDENLNQESCPQWGLILLFFFFSIRKCLTYCFGPWSLLGSWGISLLWFYFSGIYYEPKCRSDVINHSVLLVGYGYEGRESDGSKYWLIKNR